MREKFINMSKIILSLESFEVTSHRFCKSLITNMKEMDMTQKSRKTEKLINKLEVFLGP
jgi:hypothetical protein